MENELVRRSLEIPLFSDYVCNTIRGLNRVLRDDETETRGNGRRHAKERTREMYDGSRHVIKVDGKSRVFKPRQQPAASFLSLILFPFFLFFSQRTNFGEVPPR